MSTRSPVAMPTTTHRPSCCRSSAPADSSSEVADTLTPNVDAFAGAEPTPSIGVLGGRAGARLLASSAGLLPPKMSSLGGGAAATVSPNRPAGAREGNSGGERRESGTRRFSYLVPL